MEGACMPEGLGSVTNSITVKHQNASKQKAEAQTFEKIAV
jgi:hypothetical protein